VVAARVGRLEIILRSRVKGMLATLSCIVRCASLLRASVRYHLFSMKVPRSAIPTHCWILSRAQIRARTAPSLLEAVASHLLLAGNAYIEAVGPGNERLQVRELYALRPDRMKLVPGSDGWPQAYEYTVAGSTMRFDQSAALPPILHLTFFNPLDDHYGLSPLEAAAMAVDTHNAAACWNKALLDNAARPSGALVYDGGEGAVLSTLQYERLKQEFADHYQGHGNAGRPLVLEGGLDWRPMSLTPRDMDFLEAKHAAAWEIALAFGVPPMLFAIPGDNTYSNYQEANRVFWRQSVLPLASRITCALTHWLAPVFGEGLVLAADIDRIEALSADRAALWTA
jgi:HK97 family phage portal protein